MERIYGTMKLKNIPLYAAIIILFGVIVCHAGETGTTAVVKPAPSTQTVSAVATSTNDVDNVTEPDPIPSNSVVRVMAMVPDYEPMAPWARLPPQESTGSGCVIEGNRILTTAHGLMPDVGVIRIQRSDGGSSCVATVERLNYVVDLAVLKVEKTSFFDGLLPLSFADDLPSNATPVRVIGFPNGEPTASVCEGVVIDVVMNPNIPDRVTPMLKLAVTNTAPGSSGSPVILAGNLIAGVVSSGDSNEVFAVPASVIQAFLAKVRLEETGESCLMGVSFQNLINPAMRNWKKLKPGQTGQLITKVSKTGTAYGKFMVGDVMITVDGIPIGDDGTIALPGGRRIQCNYHFMHKFGGDTLRFSVIRNGKLIEVNVPATSQKQAADPMLSSRPSFYMHAGLIFMPLTKDLAQRLCTADDYNERDAHIVANSILKTGDDASVIVSRVLPDEITEKCEPVVGECVKTIDGREVKDLGAIRQAIESGKDPFIVIEFQSGTVLVFDRAEARTATARIMRRLEIPANYSSEVRP